VLRQEWRNAGSRVRKQNCRMSTRDTVQRGMPQLPRAIIAFTGLILFHFLSGDSLASWLTLGLALLAILSRLNGLQERLVTRIELSTVATLCLLVYLQGGFIEHFNHFTWPLGLSVVLLLAGLNAINFSAPQLRIAVTPVLLLLFFAAQRYFYPSLNHQFENPLLAIGLMFAAWELISALIHSKENAPSWTEAGSSLALALIYFNHTSNFLAGASVASVVILASFIGFRQMKENPHLGVAQSSWPKKKGISPYNQFAKPYGALSVLGLILFVTSGWILADRFSELPSSSLREPAKPLHVEQRNRMDQPFIAFRSTGPKPTESLQPLNLSILEEALRSAVERRSAPNRRNVIVRSVPDTAYRGLNVDRQPREPIQTTRVSKVPGLRITAPNASQTLPSYTLTTDINPEALPQGARPIEYDFGFGNTPSGSESNPKKQGTIEWESAGDPIRLTDVSPSSSTVSSRTAIPDRNPPRRRPKETTPRNIQASVGYSPELEYAANVSVSLRANPVMEVYVPGTAKWMNELYVRFNTLEDIQNDRFAQADQNGDSTHAIDQPGWNPAPGIFQSGSDRNDPWTVALAYDWNNPLPVLGPFQSIRIPEDASLEARENSFTIHQTSGSAPLAYQISGLQLSDTILATSETLTPQEIERLTALPLSRREIAYLKRLGTRIGGNRSDSRAFARRVGSYFEKNHPYSFDFQFTQGDEHLLVSWLKARSPGICGYYAGAFTLLARARGIPARVVVGALTREFDSKSRKFVVRDRDAHAWAEYLNEEDQWVRVDLTPVSLESPRFASENSRSDSFATHIQSALERLENGAKTLESGSSPKMTVDAFLASESPPTETDSLSEAAIESVPRTLDLIDKVLSREAETTYEILQTTAALVPEPDLSPAEKALPLPKMGTPQEVASAVPVSPPAPTIQSTPPPGETTMAHSVTPFHSAEIPPIRSSPSVFHRISIHHWFMVLLLAMGVSQFLRSRKNNTNRHSMPGGPVSRERSLAGRLLREIDSFCKSSPHPTVEIQELRDRALQLRYSPTCSRDEVKALRRVFRQTL